MNFDLDRVAAEAADAAAREGASDADPGGRIAFVMMMEPGYLEWQAILLTATLLSNCLDPFKIYVYCRRDRRDALSAGAVAFMEAASGEIRLIEQDFQSDYPQGNKIYACAEDRPEARHVFLDSDMLLLRPTNYAQALRPGVVSGVQGSVESWSNDAARWGYLYDKFGLSGPGAYIGAGAEGMHHPYFNGGFVGFTDRDFGKVWLDTALAVDADDEVEDKRPWLDQLTLPVAIRRAGHAVGALSIHWNAHSTRQKALKERRRMEHYHTLMKLRESGHGDFAGLTMSLYSDATGFEDYIMRMEKLTEVFKPGLAQRLRDKDKHSEFLRKSLE